MFEVGKVCLASNGNESRAARVHLSDERANRTILMKFSSTPTVDVVKGELKLDCTSTKRASFYTHSTLIVVHL